ncbi:unnamed protein product, partial [Brenthis ino]
MDYVRFGVLIAVIALSSAAPQGGYDDLDDYNNDGVVCGTKSSPDNGLCVKYFECQPNAPYIVLFSEGAKCSSYLDVCCPRNSLTSDWKFG